MVRKLIGPPPYDHALRWHGDVVPGLPLVRVAHFGDCGWREMPMSHGVHTPPGYPKVMAAALREAGVAMEFSTSVAHRFEHLPLGAADRHLKLTGDPDAVLIQLGALYRRMVVFPDTPLTLEVRGKIARALGAAVFPAYRMIMPLYRTVGHFSVPYRGLGRLWEFVEELGRRWPHAHIAVLLPYPAGSGSRRQRTMDARVRADLVAAAKRMNVTLIDFADLLPVDERGLRCANGYNLNARGSARVGRRLSRWVLERTGETRVATPA